MDSNRHLILNNGKDITDKVKFCKYNTNTHKYEIAFQNNITYYYNYNSIQWIQEPEALDPALVHISHGDRVFFNIQSVFIFHASSTDYWRICFCDGSGRTYNRKNLKVTTSCLSEEETKSCLSYLKRISSINELKNDEGKVLLEKQYEKLGFVGDNTAMAIYLDPRKYKIKMTKEERFIFPFGGNASQFKAVKNAICSQISVIQGPPGTGKTQTILNIIANLLLHNKTVLVVSNNNSATQNVLEKLSLKEYSLGFLVASLGKSQNKEEFIQNQSGQYPDLSGWKLEIEQRDGLIEKIDKTVNDVYQRLKELTELVIAELEKRRFMYRRRIGLSNPVKKIENELEGLACLLVGYILYWRYAMGQIIKRFLNGSYLEYDNGKFDDWCVYLTQPNGSHKPPQDIDCFFALKRLAIRYSAERVYEDYIQVYELTGNQVDSQVLDRISLVAKKYDSDSLEVDILFSVLYLTMISEEQKRYTRLGKRIKRLGIYVLLMEDQSVQESADFMRGMNWREIDTLCRERGF